MKTQDEIQLLHDKLALLLEDNQFELMLTILRPEVGHEMICVKEALCWVLEHPTNELDKNIKFMDEYFKSQGISFKKLNPIVH